MESWKYGELIFVVLEHEDGMKVAFESTLCITVFGDSIDDLSDKIVEEVENHFNGTYTGGIRIREFRDTIVKLPFVSGKL